MKGKVRGSAALIRCARLVIREEARVGDLEIRAVAVIRGQLRIG